MVPKRTRRPEPNAAPSPLPPTELDVLQTRIPMTLLRSIRIHAALDLKSLDDFVREAIEERLGRRA
ncbi:MAG TPA: hypothetical protein VKH82_08390 [Candidatus Binatia bacterium]|nr:hypothetical protein [Candidatus Binatia bacterium]